MIKHLKDFMIPERPSAMLKAVEDLRRAECEFLEIIEKVEYYIAMSQYVESNIRRLREVLRTQDVLAVPLEDAEEIRITKH